MLKNDYYGYRYDDAIPAFVVVSDKLVHHRPTTRLLDSPALQAAMAADNYVPDAKEVGKDDTFAKNVLGYDTSNVTVPGQPPSGGTQPSTPTGVTIGTPGSFTGGAAPQNLVALQTLGALGQTTAWGAGESVKLGDNSDAYWDGSAWVNGVAPATTIAITAAQFDVASIAADGDTPGSETGTIDISFGGKEAAAAVTVTFTITTDTGPQPGVDAAITANMTATQAKQAIVSAINTAAITGVTATAGSGTVVTITAAAGTQVISATVTVA